MESADSKPIVNPAIKLREESDDWAILFDPDSNDAYGLNPVGVHIWKSLDGHHTVDDIVDSLARECVDLPGDAKAHVQNFLDQLLAKGYARLTQSS